MDKVDIFKTEEDPSPKRVNHWYSGGSRGTPVQVGQQSGSFMQLLPSELGLGDQRCYYSNNNNGVYHWLNSLMFQGVHLIFRGRQNSPLYNRGNRGSQKGSNFFAASQAMDPRARMDPHLLDSRRSPLSRCPVRARRTLEGNGRGIPGMAHGTSKGLGAGKR